MSSLNSPWRIPLLVSHFSPFKTGLLFSLRCYYISVMALFAMLALVSENSTRTMEVLTLSDSLVGAIVLTDISGAERDVGFSDFSIDSGFPPEEGATFI